ncbi:MAG TPA: alpha-L-fucosidase [Kiritimatiellia bacterium]|nr:alpha-L-fucosidase [Kiritimatiellia bacterium]
MNVKKQAEPKPLPRIAAFERMGFGLFVHWGLYAQRGQGEWIQRLKPIAQSEYDRLFATFTAKDFDADALARLARDAGARYITLTTRHHEGFSLYDTRGLSTFDAPHSPAARDLVAEFVDACRRYDIVPFLYHTTLDWREKSHTCSDKAFARYLDYLHASVEVLCRHYGKIGGLWFDGNWSRKGADWKEDRLYRMIRRLQPDAMIINNTGLSALGATGHPELDGVTFEQALPQKPDRRGWKKYLAGEMCQTMNAHWGIGANDFNFLSPREIITNLCLSRKVGANYLLNLGPEAQGRLPEYESAALRVVGRWMALHGEIIRRGRPMDLRCSGRDFVLEADGRCYYFAFDLAIQGHSHVTAGAGGAGPRTVAGLPLILRRARWVDTGDPVTFARNSRTGDTLLHLTGFPYGSNLVVRVAELIPDSPSRGRRTRKTAL